MEKELAKGRKTQEELETRLERLEERFTTALVREITVAAATAAAKEAVTGALKVMYK